MIALQYSVEGLCCAFFKACYHAKVLKLYSNYLLTYDSYVPVYNKFHRGEWIMRASGGEGALDTSGPLNDTREASAIWAQECLGPPFPSFAQVIHSPL
jgi:hypothetical protein